MEKLLDAFKHEYSTAQSVDQQLAAVNKVNCLHYLKCILYIDQTMIALHNESNEFFQIVFSFDSISVNQPFIEYGRKNSRCRRCIPNACRFIFYSPDEASDTKYFSEVSVAKF